MGAEPLCRRVGATASTLRVGEKSYFEVNARPVFKKSTDIPDYLIVIGMWFVSTLITSVMKMPYWSPLAAIPIVGGLFGSALSLYSLFYASHLLGYAVFRHAPELGWE